MTAHYRQTDTAFTSAIAVLLCTSAAHAQFLESFKFKPVTGREREKIYLSAAAEAPTVDGVLDDVVWKIAWRTDRFTWGGGRKGANATVLVAAYDAKMLYLAAKCAVADIGKLSAKYPSSVRGGKVWGDDCVDFKFSPDNERTSIQFIVGAGGACYEARNADATYDPEWQRAAKIGSDEYVAEMAIPLTAVGIHEFRPGLPLLFNFGRADRSLAINELTVLAEPYLTFDNASLLILGSEQDHEAFLAGGAFLREVQISVMMDRDQYPSFQRLATGRVQLRSGRSGTKLSGEPAIVLTVMQGDKAIRSQRITPVLGPILDIDVPLKGLAPGTYELVVQVADGEQLLEPEGRREFVVYASTAQQQQSGRIPITVPAPQERLSPLPWPLTFGVPFPWGALRSVDNVRLVDADGAEIPIQVKVTGRWSKSGSIRWLLIDCISPAGQRNMTLGYGPKVQRTTAPPATLARISQYDGLPRPSGPMVGLRRPTYKEKSRDALAVDETNAQVTVTTGPVRFAVPKRSTPGISQLWLDRNRDGRFDRGEEMLRPDKAAGPYLVDEAGQAYYGINDPEAEVVVESSGPIKACVRVSGWHVAESGEKLGKYILRYYAYRGLPYVRVYHTFIVTAGSNKATVGTGDGTPGTEEVRYRDIAYSIPFASGYYFFGTPKINTGWVRGKDASAYLLQRDDLFCKMYENGKFADECEKAEGWMSIGNSGRVMTVAVKDFWQNFPKELEVRNDRAIVHFWPAHTEEPIRTGESLSIQNVYQQWFAHEGILDFKVPEEVLQHVKTDSEHYNWPNAKVINAMGLAKTHEMLFYFHTEDWEKARARTVSRTFQSNPTATCDPEWVCESKVLGNMFAHSPDKFPRIETAIDRNLDNIFRHREMDRDYGMFNFGDSHHNWHWQQRRWNLHRIWRNTHHGWTRWPWLMYARTGRKDLYDWADRNARHVADVDHCHYVTKEFLGLPWPRAKLVGGLCDYKGFVHWASGARHGYNSAADPMLHHYYFTGDERSLTTALEHGRALIEHGRAYPHREGSGRCTSACALYFHTWDNDYLDFAERTVDCLLGTQREDGSFPQWEDFAPFLQRYVDLTNSRRGMKAMARWGDYIVTQRMPVTLYGTKISILSHAYLYTGDERYLRTAAYRVGASVDNQYLGEDPRYHGMFIVGHSNLDQSYFMQWIPYYLSAVAKHGGEPEPDRPDRTWIRTHDQRKPDDDTAAAWTTKYGDPGKGLYLWQARLKQMGEKPFSLSVDLRGYAGQEFMAEVRPIGGGETVRAFHAFEKHEKSGQLDIAVSQDGKLEYDLHLYANNNFNARVPITYGQDDMKEVYPIFGGGTVIGGGFRCYFNLPPGAKRFELGYKGRAWPLRMELFAPSGQRVAEDTWISSNSVYANTRWLGASAELGIEGWSFATSGYGPGGLTDFKIEPQDAQQPLYFSLGKQKLFSPRPETKK